MLGFTGVLGVRLRLFWKFALSYALSLDVRGIFSVLFALVILITLSNLSRDFSHFIIASYLIR